MPWSEPSSIYFQMDPFATRKSLIGAYACGAPPSEAMQWAAMNLGVRVSSFRALRTGLTERPDRCRFSASAKEEHTPGVEAPLPVAMGKRKERINSAGPVLSPLLARLAIIQECAGRVKARE